MTLALVVLALISGSAFAFYGYKVLFAQPLVGEFERYGVPGVRRFVGTMELLGAAGVLAGLALAPLGAAAAAGLTLMMVLGVIVRIRIRDAPRRMMPAAFLGAVNAVLTVLFLLR